MLVIFLSLGETSTNNVGHKESADYIQISSQTLHGPISLMD